MSDIDVRLECVRLASQLGDGPEAISLARTIYGWVVGSPSENEEPSEDQKTTLRQAA